MILRRLQHFHLLNRIIQKMYMTSYSYYATFQTKHVLVVRQIIFFKYFCQFFCIQLHTINRIWTWLLIWKSLLFGFRENICIFSKYICIFLFFGNFQIKQINEFKKIKSNEFFFTNAHKSKVPKDLGVHCKQQKLKLFSERTELSVKI